MGTVEPRKNIDALLDAYAQLPAPFREEFDLVLAGPSGWGDPGTLARLRSRARHAERASDELRALIAQAADEGHSLRKIGVAAGLSHEQVRRILLRAVS